MAICVNSEIGQLKKVLLHRPGKELEHLIPEELERLLFDDIPYLNLAQKEHDIFAGILKEQGVEVVYLEELMAETLERSPELKERFIRQFLAEAGPAALLHAEELYDVLAGIDDERELEHLLNASDYIGRCPQQVEAFLKELQPLLRDVELPTDRIQV